MERKEKSLKEVKAGDYVWIDRKPRYGSTVSTDLYQISHVNAKGRLFISAASLFDSWRHGFKPDTGTALAYEGYTMRPATDEEINAELKRREDEAKAKKADEDARHALWLKEQTAGDLYDELFRALAVVNSPESFDVEAVKQDIARVLAKARGETR